MISYIFPKNTIWYEYMNIYNYIYIYMKHHLFKASSNHIIKTSPISSNHRPKRIQRCSTVKPSRPDDRAMEPGDVALRGNGVGWRVDAPWSLRWPWGLGPYENRGKTMGKPWENHGKTMGTWWKPWENHGKIMISLGKMVISMGIYSWLNGDL